MKKLLVLLLLVAGLSNPAYGQQTGGFVELSNSGSERTLLNAAAIAAFMTSSREAFTFPTPYLTNGYRLTVPADCTGSADCVQTSGYSYWRRINNHTAAGSLLVYVTLKQSLGGIGPAVISVDKTTGVVSAPDALFVDGRAAAIGEQWYFSATDPEDLYLKYDTTDQIFRRFDVVAKTASTVFDMSSAGAVAEFGSGKYPYQLHSSNNDNVHSFTVHDGGTFAAEGCGVFIEDTATYHFFPVIAAGYDECQIDRSGRYLVIKENLDGLQGEDNRIIDLQTMDEVQIIDTDGAAGHSDNGYGVMIAADNFDNLPNWKLWTLGTDPLGPGTVIHEQASWDHGQPAHLSFLNATNAEVSGQYGCASTAEATQKPGYGNEIVCMTFDGSLRTLVVAPVMTDMAAAGDGGGGDYERLPKGNIDITGAYFFWTANLAGDRLDAFLVRIPYSKLTKTYLRMRIQ